MSEEKLNEEYIRNKTRLIEGDELIPIINKMLSEQYIKGLEQGKFDKTMELQQKANALDELEEWLKEEMFGTVHQRVEISLTYDNVLSKIQELKEGESSNG